MKLSVAKVSAQVVVCFASYCAGLASPITVASARDLYVHPVEGDDARDGLNMKSDSKSGPVKTIARALKLAGPGDTVHLAKVAEPYRESAVFHNRQGEPKRPIVLDGHGATITGAERVDLAQWEQPQPGLFRNTKLLTTNDAIIGRWFFRMNGRMNHMQRSSKGPSQPLKAVTDLESGEWTFVTNESAFYIKLATDQALSDIKIEAPIRSSGVQVSGDCAHLVIRNLTTTHVHNDGFNIHGKCRDVLFENVSAIECGDDGISAHDDCQIRVDGFDSIGNSTGFCHTNASRSDSNRVFIKDCLGFDVFVLNSGNHRLTNSLILSSAAQSISVNGDKKSNEFCTLELSHVAINRLGQNPYIRFYENSDVRASHCTFAGFHFVCTGRSLAMHHCLIGGPTLGELDKPELNVYPNVKWTSDHNIWDMSQLRFDKTTYSSAKFADYQAAQKQSANSSTKFVRFAEPFSGLVLEPRGLRDIGASPQRLPRPVAARLGQPNPFVLTQVGELPLIISAPHGGHLPLPDVDERKGHDVPMGVGGFVKFRDGNTEELALAISSHIEKQWGKKPYCIIARWHRKYLDPNRPPKIAYEDEDAKPVYDAYHSAITDACRTVQTRFGKGLLLDIHAQGMAKDTVFRGTQNGKSVKLLRERFGDAAHNGPESFFGSLHKRGWKVHPQRPRELENPFYQGGFTVQTYGSHQGFGIDAIQLELGPDYHRDHNVRDRTAQTLTAAFDDYATRYLDLKLPESTARTQ